MEFKCWECNFETDDEDLIIYCEDCDHTMCEQHTNTIYHQGFDESLWDCDHTMCEQHTNTIYHQGFDESLCSECKPVKPKWLTN